MKKNSFFVKIFAVNALLIFFIVKAYPSLYLNLFSSYLPLLTFSVLILALFLSFSGFFFISRVFESFHTMKQNLSLTEKELGDHKEKLCGILKALPSLAMIIDKKGIVLFENGRFNDIFGVSEKIEGRNYLHFFTDTNFIESFQAVSKDGTSRRCEILLNNRFYSLSFNSLVKDNEVFVCFTDITEGKELEKIKKELIVNMSHELKTPLTSIKGYTETLLSVEDPEEKNRYLKIIEKHTERLISMVNDILALAELEEKKNLLFEDVDLACVIEDVVKIFSSRAEEKGLHIKTDISGENFSVSGDRIKLEEMFVNLMENAVRYTEKGGVNFVLRKKSSHVEISVNDTGIGIPETCLPRIFERFYVVDRTRSRETGGTGLGLSIVRNTVALHKGTIRIKSSLNKGTSVILTFPFGKGAQGFENN